MGVKKLWSEGAGSPLLNHYRYTNKYWVSVGKIDDPHGHGAGVGSPLPPLTWSLYFFTKTLKYLT